jgi:hypothetical protein
VDVRRLLLAAVIVGGCGDRSPSVFFARRSLQTPFATYVRETAFRAYCRPKYDDAIRRGDYRLRTLTGVCAECAAASPGATHSCWLPIFIAWY